jgi:hypothetical protein
MASASEFGARWGALSGESGATQIAGMRAILDEVVALPDEARVDAIEAMVAAEYALEASVLHSFTTSRLRAWLAMSANDMEAAKKVVNGYDTAFERLPGAMAMRRATIVQTVARVEMTPEEVTGLFALIPSIVQQVPRAVPSSMSTPAGGAVAAMAPAKKKPAWKFWG